MIEHNARFWVWHRNGWVKLTLKPDQSLHSYYAYDNGEGTSFEYNLWTHGRNQVVNEWKSGGSDCDGRHSETGESRCHLENLRKVCAGLREPRPSRGEKSSALAAYEERRWRDRESANEEIIYRNRTPVVIDILRPEWKHGKTEVYDQYAELAGY